MSSEVPHENAIIRKLKGKLKDTSSYIGSTDTYTKTKAGVKHIAKPWTSIGSSVVGTGRIALRHQLGNIDSLTRNPIIDIVLGAVFMLLFGYVFKPVISSEQNNAQYDFLSQAVYSWFVILSILYIMSKIL